MYVPLVMLTDVMLLSPVEYMNHVRCKDEEEEGNKQRDHTFEDEVWYLMYHI